MKTEKRFIQKCIKTADDLPKVDGMYYCHFKTNNISDKLKKWFFTKGSNNYYWLRDIDWYLQLIEHSDKEVKSAEEWFDENGINYKGIKSRHEAIQMLKDFASQFGQPVISDEMIEKKFPINYPHERHEVGLQREAAKWMRDQLNNLK